MKVCKPQTLFQFCVPGFSLGSCIAASYFFSLVSSYDSSSLSSYFPWHGHLWKILIVYFVAQIVPALAISVLGWCLCPLNKFSSFYEHVFPDSTRCFRLILYCLCPSAGISFFSKKPWILFIGEWHLETQMWSFLIFSVITSRPFQQAELRHICVYSYAHACLCSISSICVLSHKFILKVVSLF